MSVPSLAEVMCADSDVEPEHAELMKECARTVLETILPSEINQRDWEEFVVTTAKARVGMLLGKSPSVLEDIVLPSLVTQQGQCKMDSVNSHRFASNMRRELPIVSNFLSGLIELPQYQEFNPFLKRVRDDIAIILEALKFPTA